MAERLQDQHQQMRKTASTTVVYYTTSPERATRTHAMNAEMLMLLLLLLLLLRLAGQDVLIKNTRPALHIMHYISQFADVEHTETCTRTAGSLRAPACAGLVTSPWHGTHHKVLRCR
jgi:hypothetical protein